MTPDQLDLATKAVMLRILAKRVDVERREVDRALTAEMSRGDRLAARLPNHAKVGSATLTDPKGAFRVTDRAAFVDWVERNAPGEISYAPTVRSSYETALFARLLGGEVPDGGMPDGVDYVEASPVLQVRTEPGAEAEIRAALSRVGGTLLPLGIEPPIVPLAAEDPA